MTADEFALRLTENCAVTPGSHVLAAVSGGADSVALLCFLCEVRGRLALRVSCAHVEHGIRGGASLEDMAFVRALCEEKGIPFYAARVNAPAAARARGCGLEEAARALRYDFLQRTAAETGADCIALAHHAMDQAETVLLHAARGSDVRGLCAMRARSGVFVRPLLTCMPQELRGYLAGIGQPFREDETNADVRYARNRVRHEALPALEAAYPGAVRALCQLAQAAQRDEAHFSRELAGVRLTAMALVDGEALERSGLVALDDALLGRLLVYHMEATGLGAQDARTVGVLIGAVRGEGAATVNLVGGGHAFVGKRWVCLTRPGVRVPDTPLLPEGETVTPFGTFIVRPAQLGETGDGKSAQVLPASQLTGASVTGRRPGDRMTPFGAQTPVPLRKLMIDAGIERPLRSSLPVLRQGGSILFVGGLRPAEQCRVRPGEPAVLVIWDRSRR